jgi:hypothetical protein
VELTGIEREQGHSSNPGKMAGWCAGAELADSKVSSSRTFTSGSRTFAPRLAELEGAIANVTRALATASDDDVVMLARVRDATCAELRELRTTIVVRNNVVPLDRRK